MILNWKAKLRDNENIVIVILWMIFKKLFCSDPYFTMLFNKFIIDIKLVIISTPTKATSKLKSASIGAKV